MNSVENEVVFEDDRVVILDNGGNREFFLNYGEWTSELTRLAKKHRVRGLELSVTKDWTDQGLTFLQKLPDVISLHVTLPFEWAEHSLEFLTYTPQLNELVVTAAASVHWKEIERLKRVSELGVFKLGSDLAPEPIDFPSMHNVRSCRLSWSESWKSVLQMNRLTKLEVFDEDAKLRNLDCSELESLESLTLLGCASLAGFKISSKATLTQLHLNGTPRLRPPWNDFCRNLKQFTLVGRLGASLSELNKRFKSLERISISGIRRLEDGFAIRSLPSLKSADVLCGMSDEDRVFVRFLNRKACMDGNPT